MMRAMRTGVCIAGAGARRRGFEQVKVDEGADVRLAGVAGEAAEGGQGHFGLDDGLGVRCDRTCNGCRRTLLGGDNRSEGPLA